MKLLAPDSGKSEPTLLHIEDLRVHFYMSRGIVKAVDGVSLEIRENEIVGLVGESGCGKSMTAFSIVRLVPRPGRIVDGKITLRRRNLLELPENEMRGVRGNEISMVFQDPATYLNPVKKVVDQISDIVLLHQGLNKAEAKKKAVEALRMVRIPAPQDVAMYYPHQLSGGMKQRVVIAAALSCNPSLLIADEPTTALDVTIQAQVLDLIRRLKDKLRISVLLITHDLGIVAENCNRVYVMYSGKIVEYSDIFTIFESPVHPYTIGLLNSVLSIDEFKRTIVGIEGIVPNPINFPPGCRFHPRCSKAKAICREREPPMVEISRGHSVCCWLYQSEFHDNSGND